jgi:ubiquinone/menaquinone biosynthesis C-methylase UbiE
MEDTEFDKIAREYNELHAAVTGASGESIDFFAEYKVKDTVQIIEKCGFSKDLAILDFGSGIGGSIPHFIKYLPHCWLTCLDVSRNSLGIAAEKYKGKADFVHFDGWQIPFADGVFHSVFVACVFHHIPPEMHLSHLQEIFRVLKPGGIILVFEHNPYNPITVRAVNACSFDSNAILIRGASFLKMLKMSGFIKTSLHYRIFFPGALRLLRPFEKYMAWLPLGAQYYVTAQKIA